MAISDDIMQIARAGHDAFDAGMRAERSDGVSARKLRRLIEECSIVQDFLGGHGDVAELAAQRLRAAIREALK